ncbi:hypothetical protein ACLOAV_000261 [Pseudogymnoascus australis]
MEDSADTSPLTTTDDHPSPLDDWADNESVTTDEEPPAPPSKKNIHSRRWKLTPKGNDTFLIEGGREPKEIQLPPRLSLSRRPGRNGHVSTGIIVEGYVSRTLETMREEFIHYRTLWLKSPAYTSLQTTIRSLKDAQESHAPIDNIVCLALGSPQHTKEVCRAASLTQLAVLMTIIELLDLDPQTKPGHYTAQDPLFSPLDAEFLASLGFVVRNDPEGFLAITDRTLVYSISGYLYMDWVISRGPWPAALVCGDVEAFIDSQVEAKRVEEAKERRERVNLVIPTERERGRFWRCWGCDVTSLVSEDERLAGWEGIEWQTIYWRRKE